MSGQVKPIRLVHFVGEGVFAPVLDSQIVVPLRMLGEVAPHVRRAALILTGIRHRRGGRGPERIEQIRRDLPGVKLRFRYRLWGGVPLEGRTWARKLRAAIRAFGYAGDDPVVVHCRGQATAAAAGLLKRTDPRIRVLMDIRGAPLSEVGFAGLRGAYYRRRARINTAAAWAGADAVNVVSARMLDHLRESGQMTRPLPHTIVGCCVDLDRFRFDARLRAERRGQLDLNGKFVVCYCGAMSHWQRPDALAEAFAAIAAAMPDAHMLVLSREPDPLLEHLDRLGADRRRLTVTSAPHEQVASYLMAADVGLLLREDTIVNRVASPVKFAEYLRCGLPVILTPYIGDFGELVAREHVGRTIDFPVSSDQAVAAAREVRARLEAEGDRYRAACSQVAADRLSWQAHIPKLIDLYGQLAGGPGGPGAMKGTGR